MSYRSVVRLKIVLISFERDRKGNGTVLIYESIIGPKSRLNANETLF